MESRIHVERYGYRDKARIISIVDIVCSTINLGHTFVSVYIISAYLSQLNSGDAEHRKEFIPFDNNGREATTNTGGPGTNGEIVFSPRAFKKLAWMIVMAQFAIHFSQLTFAINLYIGTAKNATAKAPAACRLWFISSSILLGILGLRLFFQGSTGIYYMSEIIFRAVGMYIVGEYAKECKNGVSGQIYPPPPPVYFSSQQTAADHLSLPVFLPDLPPKYEDVIRQNQNSVPVSGSIPPLTSPVNNIPTNITSPVNNSTTNPVNITSPVNTNGDTNNTTTSTTTNNNPLPPV